MAETICDVVVRQPLPGQARCVANARLQRGSAQGSQFGRRIWVAALSVATV
jgi:hypothetical protein